MQQFDEALYTVLVFLRGEDDKYSVVINVTPGCDVVFEVLINKHLDTLGILGSNKIAVLPRPFLFRTCWMLLVTTRL